MRLAQMGLLGIVMLVAVLMVLRPAAMRLITLPTATLAAPPGGTSDVRAIAADGTPHQGLLGAPDATAGLLTDESMINIAHVEGQIRASSIRQIAELVDKHPNESVAIMRGWMATEAA